MTRFARRMLAVGLLTTFVLSGCASSPGVHEVSSAWMYPHARARTLAEPGDDHYHRIARILAVDKRALAEDLDLLFMTERSTRLTRWHDR